MYSMLTSHVINLKKSRYFLAVLTSIAVNLLACVFENFSHWFCKFYLVD